MAGHTTVSSPNHRNESQTALGENEPRDPHRCGLVAPKIALERADGVLLGAMLVQKSEDVCSPDGGSKIAKGVAV
jgi:hypothetical protein